MKTLTLTGIIETSYGGFIENFSSVVLIQVDGYKIDLISRVHEAVFNYGKKVSVRYWIADEPQDKDKLIEGFVREFYGKAEVGYEESHYKCSEYTSGRGTDYYSIFNIDKHNLFYEIYGNEGKYLHLEIDFVEKQK